MHIKDKEERRWQENLSQKQKKILFAVEIIVLLLFIGGLYVYGQLNTKLDKIQSAGIWTKARFRVNQEVQDSIDSRGPQH